jgi:hypothetical protein
MQRTDRTKAVKAGMAQPLMVWAPLRTTLNTIKEGQVDALMSKGDAHDTP